MENAPYDVYFLKFVDTACESMCDQYILKKNILYILYTWFLWFTLGQYYWSIASPEITKQKISKISHYK